MENNQQHLEALNDIRQMMKQSNKFLSLSGLSGVFAGVYALIGSYLGYSIISDYILAGDYSQNAYDQLLLMCVVICAVVLVLSILTALIFSMRKAKKGQRFFDHTAWRLIINMLIPLAAGGFFCLALLYNDQNFV